MWPQLQIQLCFLRGSAPLEILRAAFLPDPSEQPQQRVSVPIGKEGADDSFVD